MADLTLIVTGGTLDKDYDTLTGALTLTQTHIHQILAQAHLGYSPQVIPLMLKDSLDMTDTDRQHLIQACQNTQSQHLVITHGTDTLADSANACLQAQRQAPMAPLAQKTIVFTGAMRPWALGHSDTLFNIGAALTAAQCLPSGVFVCMNGQIFAGDQVQKNTEKGVFEAKPN